MKLSDENKGFFYCIFSGLLYGPMGYFGINIVDAGISISNMLFWRYMVSMLCIFIVLIPKFRFSKPNIKSFLSQVLIGFLLYGSCSFFYFKASKYIGTGLSIVIFFIYPALVLTYNRVIYKITVPKIYYTSIAAILCGLLMLLEIEEIKSDMSGMFLALLSAAAYAGYIVVSKNRIMSAPPLESTLNVSLGAALFALIFCISDGSFVIPSSFKIWQNILGIGIISTAIPILFMLEGMKYISSEKASILSVLEPVAIFIIGIAILDEKVSFTQTIGAIVILVGALLVQFDKRRHGIPITK